MNYQSLKKTAKDKQNLTLKLYKLLITMVAIFKIRALCNKSKLDTNVAFSKPVEVFARLALAQ